MEEQGKWEEGDGEGSGVRSPLLNLREERLNDSVKKTKSEDANINYNILICLIYSDF